MAAIAGTRLSPAPRIIWLKTAPTEGRPSRAPAEPQERILRASAANFAARGGPVLSGNTLALVLAGGNGTRLGNLTRSQCKPALPFAGQFRNIDFTLSNCVNSGIRRIAVLTQYKAQSLITHLAAGWSFLARPLGEFVEVWPAQQRRQPAWYAGTADAVYQNLDLLLAHQPLYTLVLAGDHIYKMDYRELLEQHAASGAQVTVGCVPVPVKEAGAFGVLQTDTRGRVYSFVEKPHPGTLAEIFPGGRSVLASMGIYVFNTEYLVSALTRDAALGHSAHDFGRDILPAAVCEDSVAAYALVDSAGRPRYWRDVGTVEAYWQAHMELLADPPPFDLFDPSWPITTLREALPPARLLGNELRRGNVSNSLLAGGVVIRGATITNSVLSSNVHVDDGAVVEESVVLPGARIGANCKLRRVVVDAAMQVPDGTVVGTAGAAEPDCRSRVTLLTDSIAESTETQAGRLAASYLRRECEVAPSAHARQRSVYGTADNRSSSIGSPHTAQFI
jgi:glucose-1-phosphate adenylyltransferase